MKVEVITRHTVSNYGSLLQAIATQMTIEKLGYSCEILDYIREDERYQNQEITLLKKKPNWYNNLLKRYLYLALRQPESIIAGKFFRKAQEYYLNLSPEYSSLEELKRKKPKADIYMTGSDQVWGPIGSETYDSAYMLSFTKEHDRRIAYAASFGHGQIDKDLQEYYKNWLLRYQQITVREDSALEILKEMDIESKQVLDPTLLLTKKDWEKYMGQAPQKDYILVYQLHNDSHLGEYAKKVAKYKGLPLIRISASLHQAARGGFFKWLPSIKAFLSYINNAKCLITDSFHGTAFAINFNTPFIEILPNNNTESRNQSILRMTNLTDRILLDAENISLCDVPIDFPMVNQIIEQERTRSINILKRMIEQ